MQKLQTLHKNNEAHRQGIQGPVPVPPHPTVEQQWARAEGSQENPGRHGRICCSGYKEKDFNIQLIQMNYVKYNKDGGKNADVVHY